VSTQFPRDQVMDVRRDNDEQVVAEPATAPLEQSGAPRSSVPVIP